MKKQFQDSWHGIDFNKFIEVSADKVAGQEFYDCFYEEFFKKYKSFLEIPDSYIEKKLLVVVRYLEQKCQSKNSVLSIGCGIGLIEKLLIDGQKVQTKIIGVEPSRIAIKWISKNPKAEVYNGFFPDVFTDVNLSFDFAYARAIEYIFDQEEYVDFLRSVVDYGIKEFSIISVSIHRQAVTDVLKEAVKICLNKINMYNRGQLWGYMRTEKDHRNAFLKAGFQRIHVQKLDRSTIVITGKV